MSEEDKAELILALPESQVEFIEMIAEQLLPPETEEAREQELRDTWERSKALRREFFTAAQYVRYLRGE